MYRTPSEALRSLISADDGSPLGSRCQEGGPQGSGPGRARAITMLPAAGCRGKPRLSRGPSRNVLFSQVLPRIDDAVSDPFVV